MAFRTKDFTDARNSAAVAATREAERFGHGPYRSALTDGTGASCKIGSSSSLSHVERASLACLRVVRLKRNMLFPHASFDVAFSLESDSAQMLKKLYDIFRGCHLDEKLCLNDMDRFLSLDALTARVEIWNVQDKIVFMSKDETTFQGQIQV